MKYQSLFRKLGSLVAITVVLAATTSILSAQSTDSERISKLLPKARSHAVLANDQAAMLEAYTRSSSSHWKSHARILNNMKEHVNELGQVNAQLSDLREEGSPWQQKAIDEIDTRLREVASHLTVTINHLNENGARVNMQTYREYARASYDLTNNLAELIDDFVDYDEAKSQADSLEHRLELPAAAGM